MKAKIKHLAILSDDCPRMAKFYETVFRLKSFKSGPEPEDPCLKAKPKAYAISDGYVGLNFNPRKPGRAASLDHFGLEGEARLALLSAFAEYHGCKPVEASSTCRYGKTQLSDHDCVFLDLHE